MKFRLFAALLITVCLLPFHAVSSLIPVYADELSGQDAAALIQSAYGPSVLSVALSRAEAMLGTKVTCTVVLDQSADSIDLRLLNRDGYAKPVALNRSDDGRTFQAQLEVTSASGFLPSVYYPIVRSVTYTAADGQRYEETENDTFGIAADQSFTVQKPASFQDVDPGSYFKDSVRWAAEAGITAGETDLLFGTGKSCTRAQAVTFLYRQFGSPETKISTPVFTDAAEDAFYRDAVAWAVDAGITTGVSESAFGPDLPCTRAQILTFLYHALGDPPLGGNGQAFADVPSSSYAQDAILWAYGKGITSGNKQGYFEPDADCTREQIVTFLYNSRVLTEAMRSSADESEGAQAAIPSASDITADQLMDSIRNTCDAARALGYQYGDSRSVIPTADGMISCDRMIAKALWDLGFTDQGTGGLTVRNPVPDKDMGTYLTGHGFEMSTDMNDIGYGSIVLVNHQAGAAADHVFVTCDFDPATKLSYKYDCGSLSRIMAVQPFPSENWWYQEATAIFNLPGAAGIHPADHGVPDTSGSTIRHLRLLNTGEDFYTSDIREYEALVNGSADPEDVWRFADNSWTAPVSSDRAIYRLYNEENDAHCFTISPAEKDKLVSLGWRDEGVAWYADDARTVPVYSLYKVINGVGRHYLTTDETQLSDLLRRGWLSEGTGWYALSAR